MNYLLLRQIVQTNRKKSKEIKIRFSLDLPNPELIHSELQKSLEAGEHKRDIEEN